MSDGYTGLLGLLLREPGCDADFESRLQFPLGIFTITRWRYGHALETGNENTIS